MVSKKGNPESDIKNKNLLVKEPMEYFMYGASRRHAKYRTPADIATGIIDYFNNPPVTQTKTDKSGVTTTSPVFTLTGMMFHLGFESRQSYYDYMKKEGFAYVLKRARMRIEGIYEGLLQGNNVAGVIFALKQMGWKDVHELDVKHTVLHDFNDLISDRGSEAIEDKSQVIEVEAVNEM